MTGTRSIDNLFAAAEAVTGALASEVRGRSKAKLPLYARRCAMAVAVDHWGWSTMELGRQINREHTTILLGLKIIREQAATCSQVAEDIAEIARRASVAEASAPPERAIVAGVPGIPGDVATRNDIAAIRTGASLEERAFIALMRLHHAAHEVEIRRAAAFAY